jgi:hypothetical protein
MELVTYRSLINQGPFWAAPHSLEESTGLDSHAGHSSWHRLPGYTSGHWLSHLLHREFPHLAQRAGTEPISLALHSLSVLGEKFLELSLCIHLTCTR